MKISRRSFLKGVAVVGASFGFGIDTDELIGELSKMGNDKVRVLNLSSLQEVRAYIKANFFIDYKIQRGGRIYINENNFDKIFEEIPYEHRFVNVQLAEQGVEHILVKSFPVIAV